MPRGVYKRKTQKTQLPNPQSEDRMSKPMMAVLAIRGYLTAILMSGNKPDERDIERIGAIIDESLNDKE